MYAIAILLCGNATTCPQPKTNKKRRVTTMCQKFLYQCSEDRLDYTINYMKCVEYKRM
jgi:hypothetical protein